MKMDKRSFLNFLVFMYLCAFFVMLAIAITTKETDPLLAATSQLHNHVFDVILIHFRELI